MPELDGYQILSKLKADPHLCTVPVIMISASDDLDRAICCIEKGAEDYLSKPLNQVLLKARISASLERKRLRDQEQAYLKQLEAEKNAAEAAHRAKSAFLANMSHELRTPLNAIIGYSEMLQEDLQAVDAAEQVADLQKIYASGKHLLHLIDNILDLAKIESGKMELHLEKIQVPTFIQEIVQEINPSILAKGNQLKVACPASTSALYVDPGKMRQILLSLINNANKFMDAGTITFQVVEYLEPSLPAMPSEASLAVNRLDAPAWLAIIVSDTGIGMVPEQVEQMFQAFAQADDSTTRKHGGAGLGLTIARRLCQLMGGDIQVESEVNKGSAFTVWLPAVARTA
ncbi:MAG: response regulator [Cyanobacteria bacterium RM1_2_2]|nr:response regulator [Cyanobacteria bacterium RM1_2_2]